MDTTQAIAALAALAQPTRIECFRLLVQREPEGVAAGELARLLAVPQNTMSAHLAILTRAGLAQSARRGRSIVYRARLDALRKLTLFLLTDCCGGRSEICAPLVADLSPCCAKEAPMPEPVYNVLFLCTGNTARSILAESILRKEGAGRFNVFSAGSQPKGVVNPFALKTLAALGYPTDGLRSKSWDAFAAPGAPQIDFIFTVCDNAAGEACPVWPGKPVTAHWGIEDPAAVEGTDLDKERAFAQAFRYLRNRIVQFTALPIAGLDRLSLKERLQEIGATADKELAAQEHGQ